jgi:hypothetical protein
MYLDNSYHNISSLSHKLKNILKFKTATTVRNTGCIVLLVLVLFLLVYNSMVSIIQCIYKIIIETIIDNQNDPS